MGKKTLNFECPISSSFIEDGIFEKCRFNIKRGLEFGFVSVNGRYFYRRDFMDGNFSAEIFVEKSGEISFRVIDTMTNEEYAPLHIESHTGGYVNSLREKYLLLLEKISEGAFDKVNFIFPQSNRITKEIYKTYGIAPDFPWNQKQYSSYGTFRHIDTRKWFALIMDVKWSVLNVVDDGKVDIINLKIDPLEGDAIRKINGVYPGYHMNHKNWVSIVLNDTLSDDTIMKFVEDSFRLTGK